MKRKASYYTIHVGKASTLLDKLIMLAITTEPTKQSRINIYLNSRDINI